MNRRGEKVSGRKGVRGRKGVKGRKGVRYFFLVFPWALMWIVT
jgi:hypothetical protein